MNFNTDSDSKWLYSVAARSDMHKLIDDMKDGDSAVLITSQILPGSQFAAAVRTLGPMKQNELSWILDHIKIWLLSGGI